MKSFFIELFEIESGEYSAKEVVAASVSLIVAFSFVFMPLFM